MYDDDNTKRSRFLPNPDDFWLGVFVICVILIIGGFITYFVNVAADGSKRRDLQKIAKVEACKTIENHSERTLCIILSGGNG